VTETDITIGATTPIDVVAETIAKKEKREEETTQEDIHKTKDHNFYTINTLFIGYNDNSILYV